MPYNTSSLNRVGNDFDFNPGGGTQVRFGEADYSEGTDMWATQVRVRDRYIHGWVPTQERESQRVWRFAESTQGWTPLNQADLSIASSDRAAVINELQAGDYRIVSPHSMDINPANYSSFQMRFRQTVPAVGGAPLWDGSVFWREAAAGTGNFTVADSFQFAEPAGFASGDWCHIKHTFNFADTWIYPSLTAYVDQLALRFFQYPINAHPSSYPQYEIAWIALDKTSTAIEERMTSALWDRTAYPAGAIELYDSSSVELAELPQNLSSQEDVRWMDRIVNGWDSGFGNILTYINGISPDESRYLFGEPHITVPKESPVGESEDSQFGDFIEDERQQAPSETATSEMLRSRINDVLKTLTYREREILKLRYGVGDGYTYTLEEVGRIFKVTRERVRQVESKAIRKLQHPVRKRRLSSFIDQVEGDDE